MRVYSEDNKEYDNTQRSWVFYLSRSSQDFNPSHLYDTNLLMINRRLIRNLADLYPVRMHVFMGYFPTSQAKLGKKIGSIALKKWHYKIYLKKERAQGKKCNVYPLILLLLA
jgi:hypothetical protein